MHGTRGIPGLICIAGFTALVALTAFAEPWTTWRNALAPMGWKGPELTLARNGAAAYVIAIPDAPTSQDLKAAQDLAQWLREMTGADFSILPEAQATGNNVISIGMTKRLEEASKSIDAGVLTVRDLRDEGYVIGVKNGTLYLFGGKKRGPIYAVYALLEEDLGCRWYAGETSTIPQTPTLTVRPVPRSFVPKLTIRDPFYEAAFNGTWSLHNRTNAPSAAVREEWGGHVDYALFVHTFNTLVPPEQYFDAHPDYYMLDSNGNRSRQQLCTTNPEVITIATESTLRILREHPNCEVISVSKNDGGGTCLCPNCKAIDDAEGTNAGALLFLVNKVAEAVEQEFPDVVVSTLAYLETVTPPKTVRPRANVSIRLCTDNCMWSHPFTPAQDIEAFNKAMTGWGAIHNRIHIWDYCVNFSHYPAPMPNIDAIANNIRFFVANNAQGVMEQGAYQGPGERDLLRCWVFAKLMWDPTRNVDDLTQDFIWGYFGKAAPAIAEYNSLLEATAREHADSLKAPKDGIRYPMDSEFLTKDFIDKANQLYDQAESLAENDTIRERVERDRLPIMYVQLCRGKEFTGDTYPQILARFETIARRIGLTCIREGSPDLDEKLKAWKEANP
ncbi:MAG: DUF4838 domain-containing protein [Candidatus Hydrogenedentes bacterium]|nr:DUF4838 domain-containing protein [Candidatus Hydrogenedentota bacterium]